MLRCVGIYGPHSPHFGMNWNLVSVIHACLHPHFDIHKFIGLCSSRSGIGSVKTGLDRFPSVQSSVLGFCGFRSSVRSRVGPADRWTGPMNRKLGQFFIYFAPGGNGTVVPSCTGRPCQLSAQRADFVAVMLIGTVLPVPKLYSSTAVPNGTGRPCQLSALLKRRAGLRSVRSSVLPLAWFQSLVQAGPVRSDLGLMNTPINSYVSLSDGCTTKIVGAQNCQYIMGSRHCCHLRIPIPFGPGP